MAGKILGYYVGVLDVSSLRSLCHCGFLDEKKAAQVRLVRASSAQAVWEDQPLPACEWLIEVACTLHAGEEGVKTLKNCFVWGLMEGWPVKFGLLR